MSWDLGRLRRALAERGLRDDVPFANELIIAEALTHSSYASERGGHDNERLEMLGDAVLGFLVADLLFDLLPDAPEGVLTRVRASLVDEPSLAEKSRRLGFGEALMLGRGEEQSGGRDRDSLLADAFEAVLAGIYRSEGLEAARQLVAGVFEEEVRSRLAEGLPLNDYKTTLQVKAQRELKVAPQYRILDIRGPDHERQFTAEVSVRGRVAGSGEGRTKKLAEQQAAKAALESWETFQETEGPAAQPEDGSAGT